MQKYHNGSYKDPTFSNLSTFYFFVLLKQCSVVVLLIIQFILWTNLEILLHLVRRSMILQKYSSGSIFCLFIYLFIYLFIHLFIYLFIYSFIHSFIYLFICFFVHLFIYLFVCLFVCLFIYLFVYSFIYKKLFMSLGIK